MKNQRTTTAKKLSSIERKLTTARDRRQIQKEALSKTLQTVQSHQEVARRTLNLFIEAREEHDKQKRVQERQQHSLSRQAEMRKRPSKTQTYLADLFSETVHTVLEQETYGGIRFGAEDILLDFNYNDLTSTALQTLKILIFDLTALKASFRGANFHPGILIHDSPREADLTAAIYHKLFKVANDVESPSEKSAFQYIITTTEPPPTQLIQAPWLVHPPFSSAEPKLRFLGRNL